MVAQQLITITDEFIQLLSLENKLLKQRNLTEAGMLHEEKDRLNGEYQMAMAQIKAEDLSPETAEVIRLKTTKMKAELEENQELLAIVAQANKRILCAIVDQFSKHAQTIESYTPLGAKVKGVKTSTNALTVSTCI